jgi:eukaryotic-like serine/threonine-protein kinase
VFEPSIQRPGGDRARTSPPFALSSSQSMNIDRGSRLGPYEVVSALGAGGMGEVWRGKDTRLDREVAIKVLSESLSSNAQLRIRFEREAKLISSLNHPHICTLFDIGHENGVDYLVMELIDGESLADRLKKGPLPLDLVLRYGAQIASALDAAHRHGIVHRDVKPGNVMLTRTGAKLLDFGLAKTDVAVVQVEGVTVHKPLTQEGTILGTFQYMAPEQLEGVEADARTDIFGLGCVLYEMATGRRAFQGASKTSLIAAIVSSQPEPISSVAPMTPPALDHVVQRCLEKNADDRWQSAHDIASELQWISAAGSSAGVAAPIARRKRRIEWGGWLAALAIALTWAIVRLNPGPHEAQRMETAIVAPDGVVLDAERGGIALSPDGSMLALIAHRPGEKALLWIRHLSSSAVRALPGTSEARLPFWSPDGKTIAFFASGKLLRVSIDGGSPELVVSVPDSYGGAWAAGGNIVFASGTGVFRVPAAGGTPVKVLETPNRSPRYPVMLPDGNRFLFTSIGATEPDALYVGTIDGEVKLALAGVYSNAAYASPGFILYVKDGALRAQRVNPKTLASAGDAMRIADQVQYHADDQVALFTVSASGSLGYVGGEGGGKTELAWVSRDGTAQEVITPAALYYSPRLSHDDKRVAVDLSETQTAKGDIWILDLQRGASTRLTYDPANESGPIWSPDDRSVMFFSERKGVRDLFERPSSGVGADAAILADDRQKVPLDVSPDGRWLAFATGADGAGRPLASAPPDIWLLDRQSGQAKPFLTSPFSEHGLQFSPDGKLIAYTSDESGQSEIYVIPFPESSEKWIVSRGGGEQPAWSADGRQIYYLTREQKLMSVAVTSGHSFDSAPPVALFEAAVRRNYPIRQYCVSRDGSRFLINRNVAADAAQRITFVQNWTSPLQR